MVRHWGDSREHQTVVKIFPRTLQKFVRRRRRIWRKNKRKMIHLDCFLGHNFQPCLKTISWKCCYNFRNLLEQSSRDKCLVVRVLKLMAFLFFKNLLFTPTLFWTLWNHFMRPLLLLDIPFILWLNTSILTSKSGDIFEKTNDSGKEMSAQLLSTIFTLVSNICVPLVMVQNIANLLVSLRFCSLCLLNKLDIFQRLFVKIWFD